MNVAESVSSHGRGDQGARLPSGREIISGVQRMVGVIGDAILGPREGGNCHGGECDCHSHCHCSICNADLVAYVRCGEHRIIPLTFANDTRREREVTLALSPFNLASGQTAAVSGRLSRETFKLAACGEERVSISIAVECATPTPAGVPVAGADVEECRVCYADLRAPGCLSRPLRIAIAILPLDCNSYDVHCHSCGCSC